LNHRVWFDGGGQVCIRWYIGTIHLPGPTYQCVGRIQRRYQTIAIGPMLGVGPVRCSWEDSRALCVAPGRGSLWSNDHRTQRRRTIRHCDHLRATASFNVQAPRVRSRGHLTPMVQRWHWTVSCPQILCSKGTIASLAKGIINRAWFAYGWLSWHSNALYTLVSLCKHRPLISLPSASSKLKLRVILVHLH
jgi:hypothetical protein